MNYCVRSRNLFSGSLNCFKLLCFVITLACLAIPPGLRAGTLTLTVFSATRINQPGSLYSFDGQIINDTGTPLQASNLFLNFAGYDPTVITPDQLLGFSEFTIPDGTTSVTVPLFTIDFASGADPQRTYLTTVTLQDFTSDFLSPDVTVAIIPVPEPAPLALITLLLCALPVLHAQSVRISTGVTGQALISPNTLELEIPLINDGDASASNVRVTAITLRSAALQSPGSVSLGDLAPGGIASLYASFDRSALVTGGQYLLTARGLYNLGGSVLGFTVNQFMTLLPANTLTGDTVAQRASDAPNISPASYPPEPSSPDIEEANPSGPDIPVGPPRPGPVNGPVNVDESSTALALQAAPDPAALTIFRNTAVRGDVTARFNTAVNDPSAASDGTLVLMTGNTYTLFSNDAGKTFSYIDPTTIFPNDDTNKLCCDQVVIYAPQVGRFFWLLQYEPVKGVNLMRLATAKGADLAAKGATAAGVWTYYDLTSAALGLGARWMDFPDLAIGNNHLYISTNLIDDKARDNKCVGSVFIRYPLADLGGQAVRDWSVEMGFVTARAVQNSGDSGFWAAHASSSEIQLWRQPENSMRLYQRKVEIPSWPNTFGDFDSITPAPRTNWLAYLRDLRSVGYGITGSTRSDNKLWFAWTAAKGNVLNQDSPPKNIAIPQPHIESVALNTGSFRLANRVVLFSRDYSYAYPVLATNHNGEIGISLAYGGNTVQPNHAVGFLSAQSVPLKKTTSSTGASTRWGDFMFIRPEPDSGVFSAAGHGWLGSPDPHYIRFGRAADAAPQ